MAGRVQGTASLPRRGRAKEKTSPPGAQTVRFEYNSFSGREMGTGRVRGRPGPYAKACPNFVAHESRVSPLLKATATTVWAGRSVSR